MNRLYRSPDDRVLAGIAGGMAETYDLDPALVRVGWTLLILLTGGVFLVLYIVMALVVPLRPADVPPPGAEGPATAGQPPGPATYRHYRRHPRREGQGALIVGSILIIVGFVFLLRQFLPQINFSFFWPLLIIVGGVLLILAAFWRPRDGA